MRITKKKIFIVYHKYYYNMVQVHFCIYKCLRLDTIQASTSIIIIVTSYIFIKYILLYQKWYIFGLDYNIIQWTVFDCHSHKNIYLGVSQTFFCQSVQFTTVQIQFLLIQSNFLCNKRPSSCHVCPLACKCSTLLI